MERADFDIMVSEYLAADETARASVADTLYNTVEQEIAGLKGSLETVRGEREDLSARYEALRKRYVERFSGGTDEPEPEQQPQLRNYDDLFRRD